MLATNSLETPVLGLIARRAPGGFDANAIQNRLETASWPNGVAEFGINDALALFGAFVAGPPALARFGRDAPLNTDDRPIVAYIAPRITYSPDSIPRDRLIQLLHELSISSNELFEAQATTDWSARLGAYWSARDRYIEAGRNITASADPRRMLEQVREPLLDVLRTSPDFRPAYDPLLRMAVALADTNPDSARTLLNELQRLQPARAEAALALRALEQHN